MLLEKCSCASERGLTFGRKCDDGRKAVRHSFIDIEYRFVAARADRLILANRVTQELLAGSDLNDGRGEWLRIVAIDWRDVGVSWVALANIGLDQPWQCTAVERNRLR